MRLPKQWPLGMTVGQRVCVVDENAIRSFFAKILKLANGCWEWSNVPDKDGYGRMRVRRRYVAAHRFAYTITKGDIPVGLELDHLCRNPRCVNPEHLEPVTHRENMLRGKQATRTHCPQGHPRIEENFYFSRKADGSFSRSCKLCDAEKGRRRRLKKRLKKEAAS